MKKKKLAKIFLLSSLFITGCFLSACGGGGGETTSSTSGGKTGGSTGGGTGGGTGSGPESEATVTYLAYEDDGSLWIVDPDNPTKPLQISSGSTIDTTSLVVFGNYYSSSKSYTDLHLHEIFWIEDTDGNSTNGGVLKKISMIKGSGTPSASYVSNITNACSIWDLEDDVINKKSYMLIETAGADGNCNTTTDNGKVFVHSGMTRTNNPVNLASKEIITGISDGTQNLSITSFLIHDTSKNIIQKCDTNLSSCVKVGTGTAVEYFASDPNNGNVYLCVDRILNVFNGNSLNPIGGVNCDPNWITENDDQAIYTVNSGNVHKLSFSSPNSGWLPIHTSGDVTGIYALTSNYVIISEKSTLKAVKKDGSATLDIYTFGTSKYIEWFFSTPNRLFFSVVDYSTGAIEACMWTEGDTTATCESGNYWAGVSLAPNGKLDLSAGLFMPIPIYKLLKVEGATNFVSGGGTLYAVDPSNLTSKTSLGTVPNNFTLLGFGIGDNILLLGNDSKGTSNFGDDQYDIFYVNLSKGNLIRVTNTPDKDEYPIF